MENLVRMFKRRVEQEPDKTAYLYRHEGKWRPMTWAEAADRVEKIAAGLITLGCAPGDRVAILGNTRLEWALCDLAALHAGCVSLGVYQTLSADQSRYILEDSGARVLFVENEEQGQKIRSVSAGLPSLQWMVTWDGSEPFQNSISLTELIARGEEALSSDPDMVDRAHTNIRPEDMAIIVYTSGTTGPPKGACLSHRNILYEIGQSPLDKEQIGEVMMFFLPLSHVGERVAGGYTRIYHGVAAAFVEDFNRILDDIAEIRPSFFGSVPRIFEKAYARVISQVESSPPLRQKIFHWCEGVGREVSRCRQQGAELPLSLKLRHKVADRLVFGEVREIFGGRVKYFVSSAAPIAREIIEFFHACDMLILEAYGQTEMTCFCTINTPWDYRLGSVGKLYPGIELKIADDGEILVRGEIVFMGYLNQPELNAETVDPDGWLHTGDLGRLDPDGFLYITGRKKEIIITSGGKNVTPANIENMLKNHPLIEQAMVHGDRRNYLTVLIGLDPERLSQWAGEKGKAGMDHAELVKQEELLAEVAKIIEDANRNLAKFETVKKFAILPRPLEVETGELTPTLKVRRSVVEKKYKDLLDSMYES